MRRRELVELGKELGQVLAFLVILEVALIGFMALVVDNATLIKSTITGKEYFRRQSHPDFAPGHVYVRWGLDGRNVFETYIRPDGTRRVIVGKFGTTWDYLSEGKLLFGREVKSRFYEVEGGRFYQEVHWFQISPFQPPIVKTKLIPLEQVPGEIWQIYLEGRYLAEHPPQEGRAPVVMASLR